MNAYADTNFLTRCNLLVHDLPAPDLLLEQLYAAGSPLPVFWLHRWEITNAFEKPACTWHILTGLQQPFGLECRMRASYL